MSFSKFSEITFQIYIQTLLILALTFPFVIFIFVPIVIFRYIVSKWSDLFIKSNGKILSPLSTAFALDDLTGQPVSTILLTLSLKGQPALEDVIIKFDNVLNSGYYPELKQSLRKWMGFFFWKWDSDFCLKNHIDFIENPKSPEEIQNLTKYLLKKSYEKNRPLWTVTIVKCLDPGFSTESKQSVAIFRFHHSLVDGNSLYKLVAQLTNQDKFSQPKPNFPKQTTLSKIFFAIKLLFYGPGELISTILCSKDKNEWISSRDSQSCADLDKQQNTVQCRGIRISDLKSIAKSRDVTVTAVIMELLTGAIRQMMAEHNKAKNFPEAVTVLCAWPMKNPPEQKLTNYTTVSPIKVPVGQSNPLRRIQLIHEELTHLKYSTLPYGFFALSYCTGMLFPCLIKRINPGSLGTVVFSNFPGPSDTHIEIFLEGIVVTDLIVDVGLPRGFPMGMISVGFNGTLAISNGSDKHLFPTEEMAKEFVDFVIKEFQILKGFSDV